MAIFFAYVPIFNFFFFAATDAGSASSSPALKRLLPNEAAALIATSTIFSALAFLLPAANTCA
jgi:hypothetical protein